jgi:tRNA U34 5-carboxymethylaminomethyl modifying GTPase MnmE/TrmE
VACDVLRRWGWRWDGFCSATTSVIEMSYRISLVGKPSVEKSTLLNAVGRT